MLVLGQNTVRVDFQHRWLSSLRCGWRSCSPSTDVVRSLGFERYAAVLSTALAVQFGSLFFIAFIRFDSEIESASSYVRSAAVVLKFTRLGLAMHRHDYELISLTSNRDFCS